MSSSREVILQRIREALSNPANPPHHHGGHAHLKPSEVEPHFKEWLPVVGPSEEDRIANFQKCATDLRADFRLVNGTESLAAELAALSAAESWKGVASHHGELCDLAVPGLGLPTLWVAPGYSPVDLEKCDAGISECDVLIAQTGTVILTVRSAGGRALSVLPPHHVVLARRTQIVADLPAGFAYLKKQYGSDYPSMMTLITGPSRTGDIERILVLGAHGPKKLTILCA